MKRKGVDGHCLLRRTDPIHSSTSEVGARMGRMMVRSQTAMGLGSEVHNDMLSLDPLYLPHMRAFGLHPLSAVGQGRALPGLYTAAFLGMRRVLLAGCLTVRGSWPVCMRVASCHVALLSLSIVPACWQCSSLVEWSCMSGLSGALCAGFVAHVRHEMTV